jgi:tRNA guanosine-2'-O-methyltransferase
MVPRIKGSISIYSKKYIQDQDFKSVSVTSHQWVDIEEVKIEALEDYLKSKRDSGWTIVAIEQTSESQKLNEFKFPKKTLILLGNEKEGIPVELIQLVDVCVEIPQTGLVRSLNVHVTGAIAIWEYVRQQLSSSDIKIN